MLNSDAFRRHAADRNRDYYGVDVAIEYHPTKQSERGRRIFPWFVARWRVGGVRHAVLLEPVIKIVQRRAIWPLAPLTEYVVDDQAMREQLRPLVRSTLSLEESQPVRNSRWPARRESNPRQPA